MESKYCIICRESGWAKISQVILHGDPYKMKYIRRYQRVREFLTDQVYGPYKYNEVKEVKETGREGQRDDTLEEDMR
jgi:hypothetical protein